MKESQAIYGHLLQAVSAIGSCQRYSQKMPSGLSTVEVCLSCVLSNSAIPFRASPIHKKALKVKFLLHSHKQKLIYTIYIRYCKIRKNTEQQTPIFGQILVYKICTAITQMSCGIKGYLKGTPRFRLNRFTFLGQTTTAWLLYVLNQVGMFKLEITIETSTVNELHTHDRRCTSLGSILGFQLSLIKRFNGLLKQDLLLFLANDQRKYKYRTMIIRD